MIRDNQRLINRLTLIIDGFVIVVSYLFAYFLKFESGLLLYDEGLPMQTYMTALYFLVPGYLILYSKLDLYSTRRASGRKRELLNVIKANTLGALIFMMILYLINQPDFSRQMIFIFWGVCICLETAVRNMMRALMMFWWKRGYNLKYVLLIGYSGSAESYINKVLVNPQWGYVIRGILDDKVERGTEYRGIKVLGTNLNFAKGIIKGSGCYNYENRTSEVNIEAKDIDSATVADVVFELPNQIAGTANAKIHACTKKGINDIQANVYFTVKDGYLPQLGSTEFMIKKSKMIKKPLKFKLQDIVNIDLKNMQALSSDLQGNFVYDNQYIRNAHITSSQKYLSLLIEGDYDIDSEQADFRILGKYNKNQISKVKILFIPLSLILKTVLQPENSFNKYKDKLKEVPNILGSEEDKCAFRVKLKGNLNNNDVKVEMKRIK